MLSGGLLRKYKISLINSDVVFTDFEKSIIDYLNSRFSVVKIYQDKSKEVLYFMHNGLLLYSINDDKHIGINKQLVSFFISLIVKHNGVLIEEERYIIFQTIVDWIQYYNEKCFDMSCSYLLVSHTDDIQYKYKNNLLCLIG